MLSLPKEAISPNQKRNTAGYPCFFELFRFPRYGSSIYLGLGDSSGLAHNLLTFALCLNTPLPAPYANVLYQALVFPYSALFHFYWLLVGLSDSWLNTNMDEHISSSILSNEAVEKEAVNN